MNIHDTFARIANTLGGIPAHFEAGIKEILAQFANHHATEAAKTAAPIVAPLTAEEIAAFRANARAATPTE